MCGNYNEVVELQYSYDTPLIFLMDSTTNPKVKTTKGKGIGARFLV